MLTRNGYRHRPVIGIKKPQDGRARDHLIVENQLAVIAGVLHFSQLAIKALQAMMPAEYQVITIRDSIAKQQDLVTLDCFTKWTTDNAAVLL